MPDFLDRLKERKMGQWALAYSAFSWVVVQLLEAVAEPLSISLGIHRSALVLLVAGFLVTLVLAWYHGEKGRQRVGGFELLLLAGLFVTSGAAIRFFGGKADPIPPTSMAFSDGQVQPTVAVLPCDNRSTDPSDAFLSDGFHDQILLKLQKISSLRSLGIASVRRFSEDRPDPREIATDLNVSHLGECSVQVEGDRLQVIFRLLDGRSGGQIWAEQYEDVRTTGSLFAIQKEIAERVAENVGGAVSPEDDARISKSPTDNLEAFDLYTLGRIRWIGRDPEGMYEALELYKAAIELDPEFAPAHAGLAETYLILTFFDRSELDYHDYVRRARTAAEDALALDDGLSEAHAALGYLKFWYDRDWEGAERDLRLATELDPGNTQALAWHAETLSTLGQAEEAIVEARRAALGNPGSLNENVALASSLRNAGRLEESEAQYRKTLAIENGGVFGFPLSFLLLKQGRFEEAREAMLRWAPEWVPDAPVDSIALAFDAIRDESLRPRAVEILRYLQRSTNHFQRNPPVAWYALLGDMEEALLVTRRMIDSRSLRLALLNWGRSWPLHDEPRFLLMLDEIGLPRPGS